LVYGLSADFLALLISLTCHLLLSAEGKKKGSLFVF